MTEARTPLRLIEPDPDRELPDKVRAFGSARFPLRPSACGKLVGCPMSVFLKYEDESDGGVAAQTGNLVHSAAAAFHNHKDLEAGLAALEAARLEFPRGDPEKADKIYRAYAADPKNNEAEVVWCERKVRLDLAPAPGDPTGEPVVIEGTLDQVRRESGVLRVWDIKTGDRLGPEENLDDYLIQQAVYVLAARQTLDPTIEPGGLIYTPGYSKPRGRRFIPYTLTIEQLRLFVTPVVHAVSLIRQGIPAFRPSAENCRWCDYRPFTQCSRVYKGIYGSHES